MAKINFEFDDRDYKFTYGKAPKGYGSWAFNFRTSTSNKFENAEPIWAVRMGYGDAKKWIKAHIRALAPADFNGYVTIVVLT